MGKESITYPKRVELKQGLKIIDNLHQAGVREIIFSSREPLLNPFICKYIERCTHYGINTTVLTNGICLVDEKLSDELIECGLCAISISLEGVTADTNDIIRGKHSFEKTMLGVETFQEKLYQRRTGVPVNLQLSLHASNRMKINDLPKMINDLPFDSIAIGTLSNSGNAKKNQEILLPDDEYFDLFQAIAKEYKRIDDPNYTLFFKSIMPWEAVLLKIMTGFDLCPTTPNCSVLNGTYSMLPDGNIIPCISIFDDTQKQCVNGKNYRLFDSLKKKFEECAEEIKTVNDKAKKIHCKDCYFIGRCVLCPALVRDYKMREAAIQRCVEARNRFEKYVEAKYQHGCYLSLDQAQILFSHRNLVVQKTYSGSLRKVFGFNLTSEDMMDLEGLTQGAIYRRKPFQSESSVVQSLVIEGIVVIRGGNNDFET